MTDLTTRNRKCCRTRLRSAFRLQRKQANRTLMKVRSLFLCFSSSSSFLSADSPAAAESVLALQTGSTTVWQIHLKNMYLSNGSKMLKRRKWERGWCSTGWITDEMRQGSKDSLLRVGHDVCTCGIFVISLITSLLVIFKTIFSFEINDFRSELQQRNVS